MSIYCDLISVCWTNTCPGVLCCYLVKVFLSSENYSFSILCFFHLRLYNLTFLRTSRFKCLAICIGHLTSMSVLSERQCYGFHQSNANGVHTTLCRRFIIMRVQWRVGPYWNIINRIMIYGALCLVPARHCLRFGLNIIVIPFNLCWYLYPTIET